MTKSISSSDEKTSKKIDKELDPNDPEIIELNRIGSLVPAEVERQRREYEERMEIAERAFGDAVRSIVIKY